MFERKFMNKFLVKYYNLLKENLAMFAVIPTVIGGIWQLFKLTTISANMIRFFSISQLVADGLLIIMTSFVPVLLMIYPILRPKDDKLETNNRSNHPDLIYFHILFTILLVVVIFIGGIFFKLFKYITIDNPISLGHLINFVCILFFVGYLLVIKFISKDKLVDYIYYNIFAVFSCFLLIFYINNISKNLSGIANFKDLITDIEKKECYSKTPEIVYFNDKYIFIEIEKKNKKSILIKQIEDLFQK